MKMSEIPLAVAVEKIRDLVRKTSSQGAKAIVIFDIDGTLTLEPVAQLYRECAQNKHVRPAVVTARPYSNRSDNRSDEQQSAAPRAEMQMYTIFSLFQHLRLPFPLLLYMRQEDEDDGSNNGIARTKQIGRRTLQQEAQDGMHDRVHILGTIGDRLWDHTLHMQAMQRECMRGKTSALPPEHCVFYGVRQAKPPGLPVPRFVLKVPAEEYTTTAQ